MGLALNSNCSFKMTTKITFGPFLHKKLFNFWLRLDFKSICWLILKWKCFEVKFSKLKNANQPVFLKIQIFEGIKIKMAENVQFCDILMIPKWFWVIFDFQDCSYGFEAYLRVELDWMVFKLQKWNEFPKQLLLFIHEKLFWSFLSELFLSPQVNSHLP